MADQPGIVTRDEQHYVGISGNVTMSTIGQVADRLGEVFVWLAERDMPPVDAPFFRYTVLNMDGEFPVEVGLPIAGPVDGSGDIHPGVLPTGRYATVTHIGHPDELVQVTADLLAWGAEQGLRWDVTDTPDGERWGCRLELYQTDPAEQPDMTKWQTTLAFRLAD